MDKVIVAFENEKSCRRIKEVLESSGTACCIVCRTAGQVRRAVGKLNVSAVVCGYKLADGTAEELFGDLPEACVMLVLAVQGLLDLCRNEAIFQLAAPASRGDLVAAVRMLLQMGRRLERCARPSRGAGAQAEVDRAKVLLMECRGMSEEQAHRFLQKKSMDSGVPLVQTARMLLASGQRPL